MSRWTIVPIRGLAAGKSRLAEVLNDQHRQALNALLLNRVLEAVASAEGGLSRCIVAAAADDAAGLARKSGAHVMLERMPGGLNAALEAARERALKCGASTILALVADLPYASGAALTQLLRGVPAGRAAVIPDKQGVGTAGLLLPAACRLKFMFGDNSLARHVAALREQHFEPIIWDDAALSFDLDSPEDYRLWQASSSPAPCECTLVERNLCL